MASENIKGRRNKLCVSSGKMRNINSMTPLPYTHSTH